MSVTTGISSLNFLIYKLPFLTLISGEVSYDDLVVLGLGPISLIWLAVKTIVQLFI